MRYYAVPAYGAVLGPRGKQDRRHGQNGACRGQCLHRCLPFAAPPGTPELGWRTHPLLHLVQVNATGAPGESLATDAETEMDNFITGESNEVKMDSRVFKLTVFVVCNSFSGRSNLSAMRERCMLPSDCQLIRAPLWSVKLASSFV